VLLKLSLGVAHEVDVGGTVEVDGCCKDDVAAEGEGVIMSTGEVGGGHESVAPEGGDLGVEVGDTEQE